MTLATLRFCLAGGPLVAIVTATGRLVRPSPADTMRFIAGGPLGITGYVFLKNLGVHFATCLEETHDEDRWVREYWDDRQSRWVMENPDSQRYIVSPNAFITGSRARQRCRMGDAVCDRCECGPDACGQWVAHVNPVGDFESVACDVWGWTLADEASLGEACVSRWHSPPPILIPTAVSGSRVGAQSNGSRNLGRCVAHAKCPG